MRSGDAIAPGTGLYLAALQFLFTLGWTIYVIYLPQLAAGVGIPGTAVILLLMLDQAIFAVTDLAMGVAADRVAALVGRLGRLVAGVTLVSCAAFLALPWIGAAGGGKVLFLALVVVWVATSSALRAPPLMLLGKYAARPAVPWLASLALLGLGVAGALAPYLTVALRDRDPRLPFAVSSVALALTCFMLARVERTLAGAAPRARVAEPVAGRAFGYAIAVAVLALGFQVYFSIASARLYLRFVKPGDLELVMPVFWGGFNVAMFAAAPVTARWGGLVVMGGAGIIGAALALATVSAGGLSALLAAQFGAGAAWGVMMMSALAAALAIGAPDRAGRTVGLMYSALAVATFTRMAATAGGLAADPAYAALVTWTPAVAWALGGALLLALAKARVKATSRAPSAPRPPRASRGT